MNIYELYGRLTEQHRNECLEHRKTLKLLGDIKRGATNIENVEVREDGWNILPPKDTLRITATETVEDQEQETA